MRKSLRLFVWIVGVFLLSGCDSDMKNIEKLNYANAIGVDYKEGKYFCYVQMADFQNVAKSSEGGMKGSSKVWIGEGSGDSFEEALFQLYETAQERVIWAHVTVLLVSENALKQSFDAIYESLSRYHEFRLTPWVFATRESIKDIFSVTGFFGRSPLDTLLHQPESIHSQSSYVSPIKLAKLIRQINEPGFTSCIPSLAVNNRIWSEKGKPELKTKIDGAVFLKEDSFKSYIPLQELSGLRWIQQGIIRAGIPVPDRKVPTVQVVIDNPKPKVIPLRGDRPHFDLKLKATGNVVSRTKSGLLDYRQLTDATKKAIEEEIRKLIRTAVDNKTDILNLEYQLFRYRHGLWKAMAPDREDRLLTEEAIHDIRINLNIVHTSVEKNNYSRSGSR